MGAFLGSHFGMKMITCFRYLPALPVCSPWALKPPVDISLILWYHGYNSHQLEGCALLNLAAGLQADINRQ